MEGTKTEFRSLIVGASGQVGTQMLARFRDRALPTSRVERDGWLKLDLAALETADQVAALIDVDARTRDIDAIFCVGGMTHVDGCEAQPELAQRTNARGPGALAAYARQRRLPFVFYSTEYVFDGAHDDSGPYAEDARTNPLSVYGKSKLEGEQRVLDAYPEALVLRTTVVYGPDPRELNYLYSLMRTLSAGHAMRVPADQISTPTYNRDLIGATLGLVAAKASGVWHVAGPELMGRLEFAQRVASMLGLNTAATPASALLQGVSTAELGQTAQRPLSAGLATDKLRQAYPEFRIRTLAESVLDCEAELREFLGRTVSGQASAMASRS